MFFIIFFAIIINIFINQLLSFFNQNYIYNYIIIKIKTVKMKLFANLAMIGASLAIENLEAASTRTIPVWVDIGGDISAYQDSISKACKDHADCKGDYYCL